MIIPAGVPRKPGMTRDDLFNINAGIVKNLITAVAKHCPNVCPPLASSIYITFMTCSSSVYSVCHLMHRLDLTWDAFVAMHATGIAWWHSLPGDLCWEFP